MWSGGDVEHRRGTEIVQRGIDGFPSRESFQHVGRTAAQALVDDGDERSVFGFQRVARDHLGGAVGANDLPVGASGKNARGQAWSGNRSSDDRNDPAAPGCHRA